MRLTLAAVTGCLTAGLAALLGPANAAQAPFSLGVPTQRADSARQDWPAKFQAQSKKWTLPRGSNNSAVVFDKYSLALAGGQQRLFVFAAEFHPWRLPVPSLWRDVLQKIRAAGFNTVSIYTHWGLIQPSADTDTIDLSGINDLDFFLTIAKEEGLFVIVRPGPYINAETTVGGMAPWTVNIDAVLRTNDTAWQSAWKPYIDAISRVVVKHQLHFDPSKPSYLTGGSVILVQADNEYRSGMAERAYMSELVLALKQNGISIPISYNDPGRDSNFVDLVDLYGLDSYPQRFDCSHPTTWVPFRDDYLEYHLDTNPDQPFYIPEFQGGSYDPYGGPGYEACGRMTNASFTRVANLGLVAQRVTLLSLYMVYGGTNWGGLAEPDVYSSYDYGAALSEHRQTTDKYTELKRQGGFIAAFPDLAMTEQVNDQPGFNISQVWDLDRNEWVDAHILRTTVLENPETKSKFYVVRYDNTTESRRVRFALELESLGESLLVGDWHNKEYERVHGGFCLNGRDSQIIPVDQQLPGNLLLRFSTANIHRVITFGDNIQIAFDYYPEQMIEFWLRPQDPSIRFTGMDMFTTTTTAAGKVVQKSGGERWEQIQRMHSDLAAEPSQIRFVMPAFSEKDTETYHIVYRTTASLMISIYLTPSHFTRREFTIPARYSDSRPHASLAKRNQQDGLINRFFGYSDDSVVVLYVDLLRNATYSSTNAPLDSLHLWGSRMLDVDAVIMALPNLEYIYWNGERVHPRPNKVRGLDWFYIVPLPGPSKAALEWKPPPLSQLEWRWKDSLPEASAEFDDADWVVANKTTSFNPYTRDPSLDTQGVVLFASEYGFHANNILWRGHFATDPKAAPTDMFVKVESGRSGAFSAWLNGAYLGSAQGDREQSAVGRSFAIPGGVLRGAKEGANVVTVLQDHMGIEMEAGQLPIGLEEDDAKLEAVKLPRGIVVFSFPSLRNDGHTEPKVHWTVQGNYRGEKAPDSTRRSLNEGGLYAEVQGWHLPGFDASSWRTLPSSLPVATHNRVVFYRTTLTLSIPTATDIGLSFTFKEVQGKSFRAQLYVNGWQMGKYINNLGPQRRFPVHSGILDHNGENQLGVSVWLLDEQGDEWTWDPRDGLELAVDHVLSGEPRDGYVLKAPGWNQLRAQV